MSDKGASRFDKQRCYYEFEQIHGFHPQRVSPIGEDDFGDNFKPTVKDLRDNRDPESIGRKVLGKKRVLAAADRYC